jgi:hypothetical protein
MASIADPSPVDTTAAASPEPAAPAEGRRAEWGVEPPGLLPRLSGPLDSLIARGVAFRDCGSLIALNLRPEEAAQGGTAAISMYIDSRCADCARARRPDCGPCSGTGLVRDLFSAWLTIPRRVRDGAILAASVELLPDAIAVVRFRVLIDQPT